jgi:hypothetical protein
MAIVVFISPGLGLEQEAVLLFTLQHPSHTVQKSGLQVIWTRWMGKYLGSELKQKVVS